MCVSGQREHARPGPQSVDRATWRRRERGGTPCLLCTARHRSTPPMQSCPLQTHPPPCVSPSTPCARPTDPPLLPHLWRTHTQCGHSTCCPHHPWHHHSCCWDPSPCRPTPPHMPPLLLLLHRNRHRHRTPLLLPATRSDTAAAAGASLAAAGRPGEQQQQRQGPRVLLLPCDYHRRTLLLQLLLSAQRLHAGCWCCPLLLGQRAGPLQLQAASCYWEHPPGRCCQLPLQ
jgi:hypothetical protein